MARRTKFNADAAFAIIARMREGEGLAPAARAECVAPSTFRRWVDIDPTGELRSIFERAQAIRALLLQDEISILIEAGGRDTQRQIRWRQKFIDDWLPMHLQPGFEYRQKPFG